MDERPSKRLKRDHDRSAKGGVPQANPFVEMLQQTSINDVAGPKKVVVLSSGEFVHSAMQTLGRFKILSAPVIDEKTNELLGFVDVRDVASLLLNIATHKHPKSTPEKRHALSDSKDHSQTHKEEWKFEYTREQLNEFNALFFNTKVGEIIDLSHGDPSMSVSGLSPLFQTIGLFQKGVNRVTVLSVDGKAENVLSQSDIIRFLVAKIDEFPAVFDKTANEIGLARKKNLIRIHKNEPVLKAISLFLQHKISGIAVVDDDGTLIGNFSASDLKGKGVTDYGEGSDPFAALVLPVFTFLKQGGMSTFPVGTVKATTPFSLILLKLIAMRVHRLWVVDELSHPIGVITLTDVMQALLSEKQADRKD